MQRQAVQDTCQWQAANGTLRHDSYSLVRGVVHHRQALDHTPFSGAVNESRASPAARRAFAGLRRRLVLTVFFRTCGRLRAAARFDMGPRCCSDPRMLAHGVRHGSDTGQTRVRPRD